ncbi:MAG: phosphoesterase, partial [Deltaproteobacteria bacterium]|nr:phosphoesterase [Deltaproteobacteria bacterium]
RAMRDGTLRLTVITDIHHGPRATCRGQLRKLGELAIPLAAAFVRQMNEVVRPDLVVHLGDAIEDVDRQSDRAHYARVIELLGQLEAPLLHVTGNHDEVNLAVAELEQLRGPAALRPPCTLLGHRLLALPAHCTARRCWTDEEEIAALQRELEATDLPVLLFVHPSLADQELTGNSWFDGLPYQCLIEQRRSVRQLLEQSGRVRAVIGGHLHWNRLDAHAGIPYFTVQSLIENVAPPDAPPLAAAAWALFELGPGQIRGEVRGHDPASWVWTESA